MLTSKQRAYLKKLANTLSSNFQIGKDGISENIIEAISDFLKANELLKLNVLKTNLMPINEVAEIIISETKSDLVQVIGRTIIIFKRNNQDPVIIFPSGVGK